MKIDQAYFDAVIDRAGTACEKWDGRQEVFGRANVIPLWVADMDFACSPAIVEALKARAWEALEAFDLVDLADRHPASLSGGQKQRVTLAAAYCSDADLIVLDEPTSGLDGRGVREVSAWCRTLAAGGKAVAIITHDNLLAALAGDAVVELKG